MSKRALLFAGSAALIATPASAVGDFRLPPSGDQPRSPPVVGPVDPDRPAPRPAPTPTPTPRPTPTPSPTPAPVLTLPAETPAAQARPTARPARTGEAQAPAPAGTPPEDTATAFPLPGETPFAAPTFAPPASAAAAASADEGGVPWPWIAGLGLLLALLGGGWFWVRRRMDLGGGAITVPQIEKPRVPEPEPDAPAAPADAFLPEPAFAAAAADVARADHPLHILIEPVKLTQTVMNASLVYKLALTNGGEAPLAGVAVAADLVAAHASLPREALTAGPETELPGRHEVASLAPGETVELKGELRLPLAQAMPIRQGQAVVFVPLARFRATAAGTEPRCFTVVVGQPSPRGALQPVRLDLGPRSTEGLTGHAF